MCALGQGLARLDLVINFIGSIAPLIQGDSGGPLTVLNEDGAHSLLGIASKRLGHNCSQEGFTVYTRVSALLPWIETAIKENGGMAACDFAFSAPPILGIFGSRKISQPFVCLCWILYL